MLPIESAWVFWVTTDPIHLHTKPMTPRIPSDAVIGQYIQLFVMAIARYVVPAIAAVYAAGYIAGRYYHQHLKASLINGFTANNYIPFRS